MEAVKEKSRLEQWTLFAAALLCVTELVLMFTDFRFTRLLWVAVLGFLCWLLFTDGKEKLFGYAFLAAAAVAVIGFFAGFPQGSYSVTAYGEVRESFFSILPVEAQLTATIRHALYPLEAGVLRRGDSLGVSNAFLDGPARLSLAGGGCWLVQSGRLK